MKDKASAVPKESSEEESGSDDEASPQPKRKAPDDNKETPAPKKLRGGKRRKSRGWRGGSNKTKIWACPCRSRVSCPPPDMNSVSTSMVDFLFFLLRLQLS